ncbi:MAG: hypothetical protein OSB75_11260 [Dehalococcoidia bacterium]|nr:hypothetical protein [Dehalococcoidia bacterium]
MLQHVLRKGPELTSLKPFSIIVLILTAILFLFGCSGTDSQLPTGEPSQRASGVPQLLTSTSTPNSTTVTPILTADATPAKTQPLSNSETCSTSGFVSTWGTEGSDDGEFYYPTGVAVASDGSVYVVDLGNNRIQKFSPRS